MQLKLLSDDDSIALVRVSGRIAPDSFSRENEPLAALLGTNVYARRVLLSLEDSDYINSSGVGWLLVCHKRFRESGGRLVMHSIPNLVRDVFEVLRMNQVFHLADDAAAARRLALQDPVWMEVLCAVRSGVVAVVERDGRFLVIRRSAAVVAPLRYCFPGGGVEAGESEEVALVRELREELSAVVRPVRRVWQSRTPWGIDLAWWLAELDGEITCNPAEVASCQWLTRDEMDSLADLLESNRQFLGALAAEEICLTPATPTDLTPAADTGG